MTDHLGSRAGVEIATISARMAIMRVLSRFSAR